MFGFNHHPFLNNHQNQKNLFGFNHYQISWLWWLVKKVSVLLKPNILFMINHRGKSKNCLCFNHHTFLNNHRCIVWLVKTVWCFNHQQISWLWWLVKKVWCFNHHPFTINHWNNENCLVLTTILFWLTTEISKTVLLKPQFRFDDFHRNTKVLFGYNHHPFLISITTDIKKTVWF